MTEVKNEVRRETVEFEGDTLYYEIRGNGEPLLLIPPAGGDGDLYLAMADILKKDYKVITYDRRANARSTMNEPQNFEISQQSRDAAAIIRAAGEESAYVFGNSSGAIIALDVAKTQPQHVRAVIAHEAPAARVHPDAKKWQRFFAGVYRMAFTLGAYAAALRFMTGINLPVKLLTKAHAKADEYAKANREVSGRPRIDTKAGVEFLMKQELLPVTNYMPDVEQIKKNNVKVIMAAGEWGLNKKAWYAEIAQILAEKLGTELAVFPGHHGSYEDMPEEWATVMRDTLKKAGNHNNLN